MFNVVLLEPEIPANTGNIGRTCLVTGSRLHLIEPMGFILNDKNLKRAGMDYWHDLDVTVYDSFRDFVQKNLDNINFSEELVALAGVSEGNGAGKYGTDGSLSAGKDTVTAIENTVGTDAGNAVTAAGNTAGTAAGNAVTAAAGNTVGVAAVNVSGSTCGCGKADIWMATTKALKTHDQAAFKDGDYIMFGKESAGIPEEILMASRETCIRIPMAKDQRSLNLSNSAAVVLYEALRQNDYLDLELAGRLHHHSW